MSTVTTYLNLVKPASPEQFSLATYNNNLDLLDTHLKDVVQKMAKGIIAALDDAASSTGLSGIGVMCNLVAVNLVAGRWYRVRYTVTTASVSGVSDAIAYAVNKSIVSDTTNAGTAMQDGAQRYVYTAPYAGNSSTHILETKFKAASTESVNLKIIMARATGTSTYAINSRSLTVEDLGAQI